MRKRLQELNNGIRKNRERQRFSVTDEGEAFVERLLLRTRLAFDDHREYKGIVIRPITAIDPVPEQKLPWGVQGQIYDEGMDRCGPPCGIRGFLLMLGQIEPRD